MDTRYQSKRTDGAESSALAGQPQTGRSSGVEFHRRKLQEFQLLTLRKYINVPESRLLELLDYHIRRLEFWEALTEGLTRAKDRPNNLTHRLTANVTTLTTGVSSFTPVHNIGPAMSPFEK